MIPQEFAAALAALRERRPDARLDVRWHASLPSTMDAAAALAHDGAAHGVVVVADEQTQGRGRRGTTWASPPAAGLYFSFVARPAGQPGVCRSLTLAAGVAVREGIEAATGLAADLKWPNDLLVGRRKLAGILAEGLAIGTPRSGGHHRRRCERAAGGVSAGRRARGRRRIEGELGRRSIADCCCPQFLFRCGTGSRGFEQSPGDILQAWRAASPNAIGTRVEWEGRNGVTAGIDDDGALLVKTPAGVERIIAGELHWML